MKSLPAPLTDPWFEAEFIFNIGNDGKSFRLRFDSGFPSEFKHAQGLWLWCPCGYGAKTSDGAERFPTDLSENKGRPHGLVIPFSNPPCGIPVPPDFGPTSRDGKTRPRWTVSGTGPADLTLVPSIDAGNTTCWHGHITKGVVQ